MGLYFSVPLPGPVRYSKRIGGKGRARRHAERRAAVSEGITAVGDIAEMWANGAEGRARGREEARAHREETRRRQKQWAADQSIAVDAWAERNRAKTIEYRSQAEEYRARRRQRWADGDYLGWLTPWRGEPAARHRR